MEESFKNEIEKIVGRIEQIVETHISIIYMGSDLVAKLTKPVNLGFVNFEPIEKRRESAKKSVEIDEAYCPSLNSKVVEIDGEPFVIMRRFDSSAGLDTFYEQEKVTIEHAKQIGHLFAVAHKKARTNEEISQIGYNSIAGNWEELFVVTRDVANAIGVTISERNYNDLVTKIREFIAENEAFLKSRRDEGFIRQTHGDGHAGNMFVENGEVKIFDGIGFKDEFSFADVIADVAFAIMDALARDSPDIAVEITNAYIDESQDFAGIEKLFYFYICYRASVRGEVTTLIANGMEGEEREKLLQTARKYFDLAIEYLPE
ncbi:MAG: hypothetical protein WCX74_01995 [Candidatus Paceibacterota bacterium]